MAIKSHTKHPETSGISILDHRKGVGFYPFLSPICGSQGTRLPAGAPLPPPWPRCSSCAPRPPRRDPRARPCHRPPRRRRPRRCRRRRRGQRWRCTCGMESSTRWMAAEAAVGDLVIWGVLKMGDPQVAIGFKTKSWSPILGNINFIHVSSFFSMISTDVISPTCCLGKLRYVQ